MRAGEIALDDPATVPLLMTEAGTKTMQAIAVADPVVFVWWATEVGCASAIARLEREGSPMAKT